MRNFWQIQNWQAEDKHLQALSEAPFRRPFPKIKIERGLYLIRGPRQVGRKTKIVIGGQGKKTISGTHICEIE